MKADKVKRLIRKKQYIENCETWKNAKQAGCYSYAIGLIKNEFFLVGDFIGKRCTQKVSDAVLKATLIEELHKIGYVVYEVDVSEKIKKGEFKIYLQRERHSGYYHFYKESDDLKWSHKLPGFLPEEVHIDDYLQGYFKSYEQVYGWCFLLKKVS